MVRALKRRATTAKPSTVTPNDAKLDDASESVQVQYFTPFQTGPSLERIPDDVLHEIFSYLPALSIAHVLQGQYLNPPVIPSTSLARTPTLRALSKTSRLLRLRCLSMAWQSVELCSVDIQKHSATCFDVISNATRKAVDVLQACPYLWPLIQTVSVIFTRDQPYETIPAFVTCLAELPHLTTIQVIYSQYRITTAIKYGFQGIKFSSVRKITLPRNAHHMIKSFPNVEEISFIDGYDYVINRSLENAKCHQLRVISGEVTMPLERLVKLVPNLKYISVQEGHDMRPLANCPFLDTIEIVVSRRFLGYRHEMPSRLAASSIEKASKILKENKSDAPEKTVVVTLWLNRWGQFDREEVYLKRELVKV